MTSLFIAVTFILIINPYSLYDTSLWLSAFATLGIVVFSEYQSNKLCVNKFLDFFVASLLSTFFAIGATFIFSVFNFNGISLLSPLSTLIFSLLIEAFIYFGIIVLIIGGFVPIKMIFVYFGDFIINIADKLSSIDFIYALTSYSSVKILAIIFTVLYFGFFICLIIFAYQI